MTSKDMVLSVYPDAFCSQIYDGDEPPVVIGYTVYRDGGMGPKLSNKRRTEAEAWDAAASKLPSAPSPAMETASEPVRKVLTRADIAKMNEGNHRCGWTTGAVKNPNPACGCMCGTVYAPDGNPIISHGERHSGVRCKHADEWGRLIAVPEPVPTEGARVWHRNLRMYGKVVKDVSLMPKDPTSTLVEFEDGSEREVTTALLSFEPVAQPSPEAAAATDESSRIVAEMIGNLRHNVGEQRKRLEVAAPIAPAAVADTKLSYEDCSMADSQAAEQYARAYVLRVGVSKETMIDAISTLRALVMTYDMRLRAASPVAGVSAEKVYRDYIGALRLAYPENPLALNVAEEVHDILCAHPPAEGDGWIAVTPETMPPVDKDVLVAGGKRYSGTMVAYRTSSDEWLVPTCSDVHNIYPPKFWMSLERLPAPPVNEETK